MQASTALRSTIDIPADKRRPMTPDESQTFARVYFLDREAKDETIEQLSDKMREVGSMPFGVELMVKRLAVFAPGLSVRHAVVLFLVSLCDGPGQVVQWAFYLARRTRQLGRAVSVDDLAQDFPLGFPTTEAMKELWDEQKGAPGTRIDNRLDQPGEWEERIAGDAPIVGRGIFTWEGAERRSDRYGAFTLMSTDYLNLASSDGAGWSAPISDLVGKRCRIVVRVIEARKSGHIGDVFRGITPSMPEVGEEIDLGVGTLFDPEWEFAPGVGLRPDDGRATDWLDPRKLYRLHDQTVEVSITPVGAGVACEPREIDDPFGFTMGIIPTEEADGSISAQVKGERL